jgi:hypothetical protein
MCIYHRQLFIKRRQKKVIPINFHLRNNMKLLRHTILPILLATIWISISEFVRNQLLFKSYWVEHYQGLGLTFPAEPINGVLWGVWSLLFAIAIFILAKKFTLWQTTLLSWFVGFVLMWVVIGNLGVLPYGLLLFSVPLSLLEAFLAAWIAGRTFKISN